MRYVLVTVATLLLGFFVAKNIDVFTETFFPQETLVARISLSGGKEEAVPRNAEEEISPAFEFCSFGKVPLGPISPIGPLVFSEIGWMGDKESYLNEWIEIKNISEETVDVSGWQVLDKDEQIKIVLAGKIKSGETLLLRRGVDYEGNLRNSDEGLRLFNSECNLADEVFASPNWPAGDNKNKVPMKRNLEDFSWSAASVAPEISKKENLVPLAVQPPQISGNSSATEALKVRTGSPPAPAAAEKININTAGYEELQKITGVGPVIAERIIEYRKVNGPFQRIEDIINVKGIGPATFEKMRDEISL